jgi:acyl-CoA synthetase (AMP-forming)/AMP-acid ligase II/acetyltransferase-like isoleucine patch superfamily enzyme/acyl carrier protein
MISSPDANKPFQRPSARTIHQLVQSRAERHPESIAIVAPGREPLTYTGLLEQIDGTVTSLRALGLRRNDRVAVVLPNGPEMAVTFLGVASAAACAPLNPAYRASEFDFYLGDLDARAVIIAEGMASPVRDVAAERGIPLVELSVAPGSPAGVFRLAGAAARADSAADHDLSQPDDVALVLHTSGTTSRPKIVPLSPANLCLSGHNVALTLNLNESDRCLNVMPLFHIHGIIAGVVASLTACGSVICSPGFDAERFFEWMDTLEPTWYTAVPTMHQALLSRVAAHRDVLARRQFRIIRSSSSSLPPKVLTDVEAAFGARVVEAYSMTEAAHQMTSNPLAPAIRKPGSVGVAMGPDVAIMDDEGQLLPQGKVGEIVIRGPNVTKGYANNPTANASAFTNGWFRTGDQGRFDEDGYLFLTSRLKEIINRGGEKIAPKEVDEILCEHPAVAQALAFAVPHPTLGEDVAAAVVLKQGAAVEERELMEFAAARLADFKVPKQMLFVQELPKGPTGKPQRIGLADKLADQLAAKREANFVAAESSSEKQLSDIWKDVLKVDQIGTRDNFFAMGGDSLAMAVMMSVVEDQFSRSISIDEFLKSPTIEGLARLVDDGKAATETVPPVAANGISDSLFAGVRNRVFQYLALYAPGYKTTRVWLHRMRGVSIGENVSIGLSALIETAYPRLVSLGNNVSIGMRVVIIAHLRDSTEQSRARHEQTVRIEDDAYIGPGVIILPNVTIGQGAVVSAGSVVSRSVPPRTLVRGNPAVPIAHCGVSLGGGVSYEQFVRHLKPIAGAQPSV